MNDFDFYNRTNVVFGENSEDKIGELCAKHGTKVLIHYGGGSIKKFGLYDKVISELKKHNVEYVELGGVQPNPRLSLVKEGIEFCKKNGVDFILAVGGGSAIDSSKAIACGMKCDHDVWDFYKGVKSPKDALGVGCVLTIPAAGSEVSDSSVITNEDGWLKKGLTTNVIRPVFSILNPRRTFTLPMYQTACGISDMFTHVMERYFSPTKESELVDYLSLATMRTMVEQGTLLVNDPNNYNIRSEIMLCGSIAHNGLLDMGKVGDWASHGIEHELSAIYDIAHGAGLSIVVPAWMHFVYKNDLDRFVFLANCVFGVEVDVKNLEAAALAGIDEIVKFYKLLGLPTKLSDANIDSKDIELMADKATDGDTHTIGNFVKLNKKDIITILNDCL